MPFYRESTMTHTVFCGSLKLSVFRFVWLTFPIWCGWLCIAIINHNLCTSAWRTFTIRQDTVFVCYIGNESTITDDLKRPFLCLTSSFWDFSWNTVSNSFLCTRSKKLNLFLLTWFSLQLDCFFKQSKTGFACFGEQRGKSGLNRVKLIKGWEL